MVLSDQLWLLSPTDNQLPLLRVFDNQTWSPTSNNISLNGNYQYDVWYGTRSDFLPIATDELTGMFYVVALNTTSGDVLMSEVNLQGTFTRQVRISQNPLFVRNNDITCFTYDHDTQEIIGVATSYFSNNAIIFRVNMQSIGDGGEILYTINGNYSHFSCYQFDISSCVYDNKNQIFYFRNLNSTSNSASDFIVFNIHDKTLISMTQQNDFIIRDVLQYDIITNEVFVVRVQPTSVYKLVDTRGSLKLIWVNDTIPLDNDLITFSVTQRQWYTAMLKRVDDAWKSNVVFLKLGPNQNITAVIAPVFDGFWFGRFIHVLN